MSLLTQDKVGTTTTTGTSAYVISGGVDKHAGIIGNLVNGGEYDYHCSYTAAVAGHETGKGIWNSSTFTLTRATIYTSSNSNTVVSWGAGEKTLVITASAVTLADMEVMNEGSTKKILSSVERVKLANITITQPVNLDTLESDIAALTSGMVYKGTWDASAGTFPGGGTAKLGWLYHVSVAGTVGGVVFDIGDNILATVNNASTTTYASNWSKHDQTDAVQSVVGLTGSISAAALKTAMSISAYAETLLDDTTSAEAVATLGLDADLQTFSVPASTTISAFGKTLVDDADAATARTTLGLAIGTNVQAYSSILAGTTASFTTEQETKLGYTTVTQAVNLDTMEADTANKLSMLYDADQSKPIILLAIGDSNMVGSSATANAAVQAANTNVYYYASDGIAPTQNPATDLSWRNVDPDGTLVTDIAVGGTVPYWGLIRNSRGFTSFAMADRIQRRTGRTVYVAQAALAGQLMEYWAPSAVNNGGFDSLVSYLRIALDAVPGYSAGTAYAHAVIMHDGTNDAFFSVTATNFISQFKELYDYCIAQNWTKANNTQWFICPPNPLYVDNLLWRGNQRLDLSTDEYVRTLSAEQKTMEADQYHYTAVSANEFGVIAADSALQGVTASTMLNNDSYVDYFQPVLGGDIDFANKIANNVNQIDMAYSGTTVTLPQGTLVPSYMQVTDNHTWNTDPFGPGAFAGCIAATLFEYGGTQTIATNGAPLSMATVWTATATFTNAAACTTFGPVYFLINSMDFIASGANLTQSAISGCFDSPTINANAGKTYAVTTVTHFNAVLNLGGGGGGTATVSNRVCFQASSNTIGTGGVLTKEAGFVTSPMLGASSTNFLGGTLTIPSGKYNIYQGDTNPNKWGGGQYYKYAGKVASYTGTAADHIVRFTTGTCTFTFPDAATTIVGQEYILRNDSGANLTLAKVTGGDTIDPSSVMATGTFRRYATDGVATWFQVG